MVEVNDHYRKATTLTLDSEKNLSVGKIQRGKEGDSIGNFLRSLRVPKRSTVIIGFDASRAVTVPASVELVRNDPEEEITGEEVANLVSQAVWRALNRYRTHAASRLRVSDTEVVLGNLRVLAVRVDGYRVINPIGFRAKRVEFEIEQTFTTRAVAEDIRDTLVPYKKHAFVLEGGPSLARLLLRYAQNEQFVLACLYDGKSELYRVSNRTRYMGAVSLPHTDYVGSLPWGDGAVREAFAKHFALHDDVAADVARAYFSGGASEGAGRYMQKIFDEAVQPFIHNAKTKLKDKEMVYWNSYEYPLPEVAAKKEGFSLKNMNCALLIERLGFRAAKEGIEAWQSAIPLLLDFYFSEENPSINSLANQRASWLIGSH